MAGNTRLLPIIRNRAKVFRENYEVIVREAFSSGDGNMPIHPGEYGGYRERLLEDLLRTFLPRHVGTGTGFIIGGGGQTSSQIDTILFDLDETPRVEDLSLRRFYPIETIVAIGEVKSILKKSQVREVLEKLRKVKEFVLVPPEVTIPVRPSWRAAEVTFAQMASRASITEDWRERGCEGSVSDLLEAYLAELYNPVENHWQNKVSFVVCAGISEGPEAMMEVLGAFNSRLTSEEEVSMDHNMFLSLSDGYQTYAYNNKVHLYPRARMKDGETNARATISFTASDEECNHIIAFTSDLCSAVSDVAVYPFRATDHVEIARKHIKWK